jgi:hypothetical protein
MEKRFLEGGSLLSWAFMPRSAVLLLHPLLRANFWVVLVSVALLSSAIPFFNP